MHFLLKLLLLLWLLKTIFFFYNYAESNGWAVIHAADVFKLLGWSFIYDVLSIAIINIPLLLLIILFPPAWWQMHFGKICILFFAFANAFMLLLNVADIFYFPFHLQRADADLFYVLRNPFTSGSATFLAWLAIVLFFSLFALLFYVQIARWQKTTIGKRRPWITFILLISFLLFLNLGSKNILLPTYPLTSIKPVQLPLVQNSFHTFLYSVYRKDAVALPGNFGMNSSLQKKLFSIKKSGEAFGGAPKNIVLFIMESVPADFFEVGGPFKVAMPFLDSLVEKSTYFSNAFSYAYSSNKGITSMLAGIPTLIDIPLYHSNFTGITKTAVGSELAKKKYESSFFIGDHYDDFGFAQCSNWLGIQNYFSMEDISGYQKMEHHTMGLHDEYVLKFMQQKMEKMSPPFFAIQYNISTHYPNDLPTNFNDASPRINNTAPMKSMAYYSQCLQHFFAYAARQPWYANTIFIFCSDHWARPDVSNIPIDEVGSFHIPIFIFDPAHPEKKVVSSPVSQLDILNTIMYYSGNRDSIISYGHNLADTVLDPHRTVFTKTNTAIYQAINDEYVLGFNATEGKAVYCYNYKTDPGKKNNLLQQANSPAINQMILEIKAFLQTAVKHYRNELFK